MSIKPGSVTRISGDDVPEMLRAVEQPAVSDMLVVDERLPLMPLFRALAEAGYTVINRRDGHLVITQSPGDFR